MKELTKSQVDLLWDCVTRGGAFPPNLDRESSDPEVLERIELAEALWKCRGVLPSHLVGLAIEWAEEGADRNDFYSPAKVAAFHRASDRLRLQQ